MASRTVLLICGNGFIGRRVAAALSAQGRRVVVHHAGGKRSPDLPNVSEIIVARTALPVTTFPTDATRSAADVAIHFLCMGEPDAKAFVRAFDGAVGRLVLISSCDVYRAYGRFIGTESGEPCPTPLSEEAPLRERRYPYRALAKDETQLEYWYEKLDAEREVACARRSETTILRLPKVYGPGGNEDLSTVYGFAAHPDFRWTHGHVENVAAAIALAAFHPAAAGEVFNVGEEDTPTMGERLSRLPSRDQAAPAPRALDPRHHLHFSTRKIRDVLGYRDVVDEGAAMRALAEAAISG